MGDNYLGNALGSVGSGLQSALPYAESGLGMALGIPLAAIQIANSGNPLQYLQQRSQLLQDPNFRALAGPFTAGLLEVAGGQQQPQLAPGEMGPPGPASYQPNLPPLNPQIAVNQQLATAEQQALQDPNFARQAVASQFGVHPIPDLNALTQAGFTPYSVNSQGGMTFHRGNLPALPRGTLPADIQRSPVTGYGQSPSFPNVLFPLKEPKAAGGAKEPTNEFQLWRRDHPQGTFADFQADKAAGAAAKQNAVQQVRDYALTNTTKVMIERAPTVIGRANRVMKLLEKVRTGPLIGRFQEYMTTDAGLRNPDYAALRSELGLLTSAITQMHVGSRAVVGIGEQFNKIIGTTIQDPANLQATLGEVINYAQEVEARRPPRPGTPGAEGGPIAEGTTPGGLKYRILQSPTQ